MGSEQTPNERILVVEDEISLRETLVYNFEHQGYQVDTASNGFDAVKTAKSGKPDMILLDIMLPGIDGFEVCRIVRQKLNVPIIFLTACDDEIDRVVGLEIGGDDYIAKPFNMRELVARVKARLRLTQSIRKQVSLSETQPQTETSVKIFGNLTIDENRREILIEGRTITYKAKEYDLLLLLTAHTGRVLSREYILKKVWGYEYLGDSRTIDVHIRWLREKIEKDPSNPTRIITIRGDGYQFIG